MNEIALTIAGSDPSGGAGIQADLKTFVDCDVYGMAVITALTVQNTCGVKAVAPCEPALVGAQLDCLFSDCPPAAAKLGMMGSANILQTVRASMERHHGEVGAFPVVVDPVLSASSGATLLDPDGAQRMLQDVAGFASLITPNSDEAQALWSGRSLQAWSDQTGISVLLKGGHAAGDRLTDCLYQPGESPIRWHHDRIASLNTHGTGCTLSAAITAFLARGSDIATASHEAIEYTQGLIQKSQGHRIGHGTGPLLHGLAFKQP